MAKPAVFDADRARAEAQRRAKILRRYAAIEVPTLADDERFAAELGLAKDTLYQLARSWRLHSDPDMLPGSFTRTASGDRDLAHAATIDPDLSGVMPTRRAVIAARLTELRAFLEIEKPTREDEQASAERLGMNIGAFRRFHRAWVLARDPAALPGASIPIRAPRRRRPRLSVEVERLIAELIEEAGPNGKALAIHREVCRRCDAGGLEHPDKVTVHQRFVEARGRMPLTDLKPGLAIDHVALQIPVLNGRRVQFAVLSAVIDLPSGRVLSHNLSLRPPTARVVAAMIDSIVEQGTGEDVVPLLINTPAGTGWSALWTALKTNGVTARRTANRTLAPGFMLARLFGSRIDRFRLRPRLTERPASKQPPISGQMSAPLGLDEARAAVRDAIAAANAAREPAPDRILTNPVRADALRTALRRIR